MLIAAIGGLAYWKLILQPPKNENQRIAENYIKNDPPLNDGTHAGIGEVGHAGDNAYLEGKYEEAIQLYAEIPKEKEEYQKRQLFIAYAYLSMKEPQPESAIGVFQEYRNNGPGTKHWEDDKYKVDWYEALAYLVMDDLNSSQKVLNRIKEDPDHPFVEKAIELDSKLK